MSAAPPPSPAPRASRRRLLLVTIGCGLGLLGGEVAARALAFLGERRKRADWERMCRGEAAPPRDREAKFGEFVGPSAHPDVIYEMVPNARVRFLGVECTLNEVGFRGPPLPPRERAPGSLRIVGLGDSVMFGWRVAESDGFLRRLERTLRARLPGRVVEVINTAVPGYNTAMEVAAFEHKALALRPDIVLVDWVGNDADLPNLIANERHVFDPRRSFLYDLARRLLGWRTEWETGPLREAPLAGESYERDPDRVPVAYRDLVGEAGVVRALRRLAALAQRHGFRVAVCSHYGVPGFLRAECAAQGWPLLDNSHAVHAALRERGLAPTEYRASDLVIAPDDPHPSAAGHALYSDQLADFLERTGWLAPGAIQVR